jgi:hypothetical protein
LSGKSLSETFSGEKGKAPKARGIKKEEVRSQNYKATERLKEELGIKNRVRSRNKPTADKRKRLEKDHMDLALFQHVHRAS